jgi:hypothetical protein
MKDRSIYGSGLLAAPAFGVLDPSLVDKIGSPNHLGNRLMSVNLAGNHNSRSPLTSL